MNLAHVLAAILQQNHVTTDADRAAEGITVPKGTHTQFAVQTSTNLLTGTDVPVGQLDANTNYSAGPPAVDGELSLTLTGPSPQFVRLMVTTN